VVDNEGVMEAQSFVPMVGKTNAY